jgi:hypothetical protein
MALPTVAALITTDVGCRADARIAANAPAREPSTAPMAVHEIAALLESLRKNR